jgi:hypothetical protein
MNGVMVIKAYYLKNLLNLFYYEKAFILTLLKTAFNYAILMFIFLCCVEKVSVILCLKQFTIVVAIVTRLINHDYPNVITVIVVKKVIRQD